MDVTERAQLQLDLGDACLRAMQEMDDERGLTYGDMLAGLEFAKDNILQVFRVKTLRLVENKRN